MKIIIAIVGLFFGLIANASQSDQKSECFESPPGEYNIPFDTSGVVKISEIIISKSGEKAFVTTEYIGADNLQASIYLLKNNKYCFAGDLGPTVDFKSDRNVRTGKYFDVLVESKSGSEKFFRRFKYKSGEFVQAGCKIKPAGSRTRNCFPNEM